MQNTFLIKTECFKINDFVLDMAKWIWLTNFKRKERNQIAKFQYTAKTVQTNTRKGLMKKQTPL